MHNFWQYSYNNSNTSPGKTCGRTKWIKEVFTILSRILRISLVVIGLMMMLSTMQTTFAAEKKEKKEADFSLPKNVVSISKTNTFPNVTEDFEKLEPSKETKTLLKTIKQSIANPELIAMLNETEIKPSPISIGYRASVYLGRWPLHYQSEDTSVIWDYQEMNGNELNNIGGEDVAKMQYIQKEEKEVKGALTNKITETEMVKKMMLETAGKKTSLPLSFSTVIGKNTKADPYYHVPVKKTGQLHAYAPAVNEKGKVVFGEVYITLKGTDKEIEIKNVTKQGIGAWIPIQDHVSLSFQLQ